VPWELHVKDGAGWLSDIYVGNLPNFPCEINHNCVRGKAAGGYDSRTGFRERPWQSGHYASIDCGRL
jgi:hypothetical protein